MNATTTILRLLNENDETLHWNYTKLAQRLTLYCSLSVIVGLLMIIFLPFIHPIAIIAFTIITLSVLISNYSPSLYFSNQECDVIKVWDKTRYDLMQQEDFQNLACFITHQFIPLNGISNHPNFKSVKATYKKLPHVVEKHLTHA